MIGKLFDLVGETIIPKSECFIIEPIKRVIDEYPKDYQKILVYLHWMKSMSPDDNPYADIPLEKREEVILHDLGLNIDSEDPTIRAALECVEEKYSTVFYRVYRGFHSMLDKIAEKMLTEEVDFSKEGNAATIKGYMKDYEAMRKSFKVAYQDYKEEIGGDRGRGGAETADDENEDY